MIGRIMMDVNKCGKEGSEYHRVVRMRDSQQSTTGRVKRHQQLSATSKEPMVWKEGSHSRRTGCEREDTQHHKKIGTSEHDRRRRKIHGILDWYE